MPLSSIYRWVKKSMSASVRRPCKTKQRRSSNFRPHLEQLEHRRLLSASVELSLGSYGTVYSYAGVGLQENEVATLQTQVSGQADPNKGDFHASIQWGDGQSSTGDLVYTGTSGDWAEYIIKGSHIYQQANTNVPIVLYVTGPDGTSVSDQTASADVVAMPSSIPGTPPSPLTNGMQPANVELGLGGYGTVYSYAGVGFQENELATLQVQLNGQADPNLSDFHVQINWGDRAAWTTGDLVYTGTSGDWAEYMIKGSHVYQQANTNIPIVVYVTGPDGTSLSDQTASADVVAMPSSIPGTPPSLLTNGMQPANVELGLGGYGTVYSYAGVGFQENELATLQVQLNGQADPNLSDFHVQINWGDSAAWTTGDLVYTGTSGDWAEYMIKGSHVYQQANTNIPIVVYVTGPDGTSLSDQTASADVAPSLLTLGSLSPTQWTQNEPGYDGVIAIGGGSGTYDNPQVTGLPTGLSASLSGNTIMITGTPTQSGTFSLAVSVEDSNGSKATGSDTLIINATAMTLGSLSPTQWTQNEPGYDGVIAIGGGSGTYDNPQVTGLPTGLSASLSGNTIMITGTPTQSGTFSLAVSVEDSNGSKATGSDTLIINATAMTLGSLSPTQWTQNEPGYDGVIAIGGGSGTYDNPQVTGLPTGLSASLSGNTIMITGTPTQSGTFSLTVSVEDSNGSKATGSETLTIAAAPALTLGNLSPTQWTQNEPGYLGMILVSGGTGNYGNLQVTGLPAGLSAALSGSTITISGTPTQSGTFSNIAVSLQDGNGDLGSGAESLTVNPAPPVSAPTLGTLSSLATVNVKGLMQARFTMPVTGGAGGYRLSSITGLPAGLKASLSGNTITVSGRPSTIGSFHCVVNLTDAKGAKPSNPSFTLTINASTIGQSDGVQQGNGAGANLADNVALSTALSRAATGSVTAAVLRTIISIESTANTSIGLSNPGYAGPFQISVAAAKQVKYNLTLTQLLPLSTNVAVAAKYLQWCATQLVNNGIPVTTLNLYLAYQQGPTACKTLLTEVQNGTAGSLRQPPLNSATRAT